MIYVDSNTEGLFNFSIRPFEFKGEDVDIMIGPLCYTSEKSFIKVNTFEKLQGNSLNAVVAAITDLTLIKELSFRYGSEINTDVFYLDAKPYPCSIIGSHYVQSFTDYDYPEFFTDRDVLQYSINSLRLDLHKMPLVLYPDIEIYDEYLTKLKTIVPLNYTRKGKDLIFDVSTKGLSKLGLMELKVCSVGALFIVNAPDLLYKVAYYYMKDPLFLKEGNLILLRDLGLPVIKVVEESGFKILEAFED